MLEIIPKGLGLVVVLEHLGHATLDIENARGIGNLGLDVVGDAEGMLLGGVLALEHRIIVLSHGGGGCSGEEPSW